MLQMTNISGPSITSIIVSIITKKKQCINLFKKKMLQILNVQPQKKERTIATNVDKTSLHPQS